jgi:hypothetical protein
MNALSVDGKRGRKAYSPVRARWGADQLAQDSAHDWKEVGSHGLQACDAPIPEDLTLPVNGDELSVPFHQELM